MKIETALSKFTIQLEADGRASSTIAQYERHIRLFAHWIAQDRHCGDLSKITHEDIARFLSSPQTRTRADGRPKKATTVNVLRSSLKVFFSYLHQAGYISHNPGRLIRRAICSSPPPRSLSKNEVERLMTTLSAATEPQGKRDHVLFHLMLATGIRLASIVGLDAEDVDLENSRVLIRSAKRDQPEWVVLGKKIKSHLRKYLHNYPTGPLFTNRMGQRLSHRQVQRRFGEWTRKAGFNRFATVHSLRHTLGKNLYRKTGDVFLVKEMLRHKSITSTLVYARPEESHIRSQLLRKLPQYA